MTKLTIQTKASVSGKCVDAEVVSGPAWAKNFRNVAWAPTHEEAFVKVRDVLAARFPNRLFQLTHDQI